MKNKFNYSLKGLVVEVQKQGAENLSTFIGLTLTEESRKIALLIYKLIMNTTYFKEDTKKYLSCKNGSYRCFPKNDKCSANRLTSISRINYDFRKMKGFLGIDDLSKLFDGTVIDLNQYKQKLMKEIKKQEYEFLFRNYWIKPNINVEEVESIEVLSEQENQDFETLEKYGTIEGKMQLENLMSERIAGHIKYLQSKN